MPFELAADIGGTFTDVVLEVAGTQTSTKVLTTYAAPEDAVLDGTAQVCAKAGIAPGDIGQIIHGHSKPPPPDRCEQLAEALDFDLQTPWRRLPEEVRALLLDGTDSTTATTILALIPVLTSTGKGADIMVPMAIPTFGGMLLQVMTMFVVPVLYSALEERRVRGAG